MSYSPAELLVKRVRGIGGISAIVMGIPGSGKTTLLLHLASRIYKNDIVVWRGMFSAQFERFPFPDDIVLYFLERDYENFRVYDAIENKKADIEDYYPIIVKPTIKQLYRKMKRGKFNVLYLYRDDWFDFLRELVFRTDINWITTFFDEFRDLAPMYPNKIEFRDILRLEPIIREARKRFLSIYANIHQYHDLHFSIRDKMMLKIYLKGAKRIPHSRVFQRSIDKLKPGEAIVEGSEYVWITFPKIPYKTSLLLNNPEWLKREEERLRAGLEQKTKKKRRTKKKTKK